MFLNFINNLVFRTCGTEVLDLNRSYPTYVETYMNKPRNGSVLFASPACEENFRTWAAWCRSEDYETDALNKWIDFRLNPSSKVWIIQTLEDVISLPYKENGTFSFQKEVDYDAIFNKYHFDAIFVNYSELCMIDDSNVEDFIANFDCDTLCVRNLKKVDICHKRQYIYLKEADWLRKYEAKKAHKAIWAKGFIDGNEEEVTFFFAHGSSNGCLEFAPDHFTDHEHIAKYLEDKASAGRYSKEFYSRHERSPWYKETVITHGCFDGTRAEVETKNFRIVSATPFRGCTSTYVEGRREDGYLRIAIFECTEDD